MNSIAEKYAQQYMPNGEVSLADLIQAAVDESLVDGKLAAKVYQTGIVERDERIRQLEAQSLPVVKTDDDMFEILGEIAESGGVGRQPRQSVPVVGEPDCYDAGLLGDFGGGNVEWWRDYIRAELARAHEFYVSQWPSSIPAADLDALREKAAQLEQEIKTERMRLAACGVIAMANTADSAINARDMLPEYWSASAQDCASAVDREMDYRSRLAVTERERDELRKLLEEARDDVNSILNDILLLGNYPHNERRIRIQQELLAAIDAAIAQEGKK